MNGNYYQLPQKEKDQSRTAAGLIYLALAVVLLVGVWRIGTALQELSEAVERAGSYASLSQHK